MATSPPTPPAKSAPTGTARPSLEKVVRDWASTLTPTNAPDPKATGPLAWARGVKVDELLLLLKKAGY